MSSWAVRLIRSILPLDSACNAMQCNAIKCVGGGVVVVVVVVWCSVVWCGVVVVLVSPATSRRLESEVGGEGG